MHLQATPHFSSFLPPRIVVIQSGDYIRIMDQFIHDSYLGQHLPVRHLHVLNLGDDPEKSLPYMVESVESAIVVSGDLPAANYDSPTYILLLHHTWYFPSQ